jgi:hypothetical protein
MPMLDLSQATVALQRLLELCLPLIEPSLTGAISISTLPPERTQGGVNQLSLYCYHVSPDPSNRYRPRQASGPRPIATSPLTLILNYIVTAHTLVETEFNALAEQRLLGYAMKAFHDFPVIDDSTRIAGQFVLPDAIRGQNNSLSIAQLRLTAGESLNYWANENQITVKPSCYYEVAAVELEPEPPDRLPGIVIQVGGFVFPKNMPTISASSSQVAFDRPISLGGGDGVMTASPARIGPVSALPPHANVMRLTGHALATGSARRLHISHPFWTRQFPGGRVALDLSLNGGLGWALSVADEEVTVTLGNDLRASPPEGGASVDLSLYPGSYLAAWEIERRVERDGLNEALSERSNTAPFMVYPRITSSLRDNGTGQVTLSFGGSWLLNRGRPAPTDPALAPELDIGLSVDGRAYALVSGVAPSGPGTFVIDDHTLTYAPSPPADTTGEHAVRVVVDGADSQPFWIVVP